MCSPEEQTIASHAPAMVTSLFKSLSEYYGDDTRFKIGVLAFTSLVEPNKSPFFPFQSAPNFPDDFVQKYNDYSDVIDNIEGNDYPEVLAWGINTFKNSTADNKILVLITDGWFVEGVGWRGETINLLNSLNNLNSDIKLILLRLNCPIQGERYKNHDLEQQTYDNAVWDIIPNEQRLFSNGNNSLINKMLSHPFVSSLLPPNSKSGWWSNNVEKKIPVDIPGNARVFHIGIASVDISNTKFVDDIDREVDDIEISAGKPPHYIRVRFETPNTNCREYNNSRFVVPTPQSSGTMPFVFYWFTYDTLDEYFSLSATSPQSEIIVINNQTTDLTFGPIAPSFSANYEQMLNCYELWLSVLEPGSATAYTTQIKRSLTLSDVQSGLVLSVAPHEQNQYRDLDMYIDIVKFPKDSNLFESIKRANLKVRFRFRPALGTEKICIDYNCRVSFDYLEGKYYPTGENISPVVWAIFSNDYDTLRQIDKCNSSALYPLPSTGRAVQISSEDPSFYAANLSEKGANFILTSSNVMSISLPNQYLEDNTAETCGLQFISIQWQRLNDETGPYWMTIKCPILEQNGICEESTYYWITEK